MNFLVRRKDMEFSTTEWNFPYVILLIISLIKSKTLVIPCPFPRLKFTVYDFHVTSADESIGEAVISFRK